jgi:hypothetical protein
VDEEELRAAIETSGNVSVASLLPPGLGIDEGDGAQATHMQHQFALLLIDLLSDLAYHNIYHMWTLCVEALLAQFAGCLGVAAAFLCRFYLACDFSIPACSYL